MTGKDELDALRDAAEVLGSAKGLWDTARIQLDEARSQEMVARNGMIEARKMLDLALEAFHKALPKESK